MFLTGYHGTSLESANNILKTKEFNVSSKDTEWLGTGIYFYNEFSDAYEWRDSEAVLHSVIKIDSSEYLDIDSEEGKKIYNEIKNHIVKMQGKDVDNSLKNVQKNTCAVMRMLWENEDLDLKVISASFPKGYVDFRTLLDTREKRKEFCVRNNECIKYTQLIRKGDLDD